MATGLWLAVVSGVVAAATAACPPDWLGDRGNCYWVTPYQVEWKSGSLACYTANPMSQMVTIQDMVENAFVAETVLGTGDAWIGIWRKFDDSDWEWIDKSPVNYTNWCEGQPRGDGQLFAWIAHTNPNGCWSTSTENGFTDAVCEGPDY